ncbi:hypothetical protein GGR34_000861 [Microvirga flocculans]|uniref:Uncharacterized protein n=1 Tax=Microvirga flocculans TaxID=217168 RepID=A0A7W6N734_9HYPH|nr:hypothetical protein [Microvirga flocculans]MBB4039226.1 hypothetical protein [Microvirga flocculans]
MRKIAAAVVTAILFPATAIAALDSYANFTADLTGELAFTFDDTKAGEQCPMPNGKNATLAIRGANRGNIISRGCWEELDNGNYRVHLFPQFPISGDLVVSKDQIKKF